MHGQSRVGVVATSAVATDALDRLEVPLVLQRIRLVRLDTGRSLGQDAGLQDAAAIVPWATIVKALADDLASLDDDAAMAVVEGGQGSLVKTKIQILIGLHCCGLRFCGCDYSVVNAQGFGLLVRWSEFERCDLGFRYLDGELPMLLTVACACVLSCLRNLRCWLQRERRKSNWRSYPWLVLYPKIAA